MLATNKYREEHFTDEERACARCFMQVRDVNNDIYIKTANYRPTPLAFRGTRAPLAPSNLFAEKKKGWQTKFASVRAALPTRLTEEITSCALNILKV